MQTRRIEEIALNAWPALEQLLFDGWIVRFSAGYTKRANSVNPLYPSTLPVEEKVIACEALYRARGLRPTFRLTPFSSPPELDAVLASRDYGVLDPTLVLQRNLGENPIKSLGPVEMRHEELDRWMALFCRLRGASLADHGTHQQIIARIPGKRFLASLADPAGKRVACGLGVLEGDAFGLFDLVTDPTERGKGYGTQLVAGMLRWAQERGAQLAYLQVMETNVTAQKLYARFGFQESYPYWYRVPTAEMNSPK